MELDSSPIEIDQLRRSIDRLKIEESYLSQTEKEDESSKERLAELSISEISEKTKELNRRKMMHKSTRVIR